MWVNQQERSMTALTEKQAEVFEFIKDFITLNRYSPTRMEIAEASSLLQHHDDLATTHPILSKHWPDFPPEAPPHVRELKLRRDVERLHRLPARVTFELLCEIGATRQIQTHVEHCTATFANIDPAALVVTGGDRFPPPPIHEIQP